MKVTKDMGILDAVNAYPDSVNVFSGLWHDIVLVAWPPALKVLKKAL